MNLTSDTIWASVTASSSWPVTWDELSSKSPSFHCLIYSWLYFLHLQHCSSQSCAAPPLTFFSSHLFIYHLHLFTFHSSSWNWTWFLSVLYKRMLNALRSLTRLFFSLTREGSSLSRNAQTPLTFQEYSKVLPGQLKDSPALPESAFTVCFWSKLHTHLFHQYRLVNHFSCVFISCCFSHARLYVTIIPDTSQAASVKVHYKKYPSCHLEPPNFQLTSAADQLFPLESVTLSSGFQVRFIWVAYSHIPEEITPALECSWRTLQHPEV